MIQKDVELIDCVHCFLEKSNIEMDEKMSCDCPNGSMNFCSFSEITHAPLYLFIYLTRGSYYTNGSKNNTFVKYEERLSISTINGKQSYRLISVIEHIGSNDGGHYYCKCNYEEGTWWMISDEQVDKLDKDFKNIISKKTIAFMFKKT